MYLFRIISLNLSGVFLFLSYTPLYITYLLGVVISSMMLTVGTFAITLDIILCILVVCFLITTLLVIDSVLDSIRGLNSVGVLVRIIQYCFLWFVFSEFMLFVVFFYTLYSECLLINVEFTNIGCPVTTKYSNIILDLGYIFYWFLFDFFNIILNTVYLFISGLCCNNVLSSILCREYLLSKIILGSSIFLGLLFIWNQVWEFNILIITLSVNIFCTILFSIDTLHFMHVLVGIVFMIISIFNIQSKKIGDIRIVLIVCIIFYWHFVDIVWFFLLRFIYLDTLMVLK
uniref:Cytochrome c oxidase subunit 3 n=1 Tax=Trypanoplasma borreli TaxID=5710 RepID=COX3_TRYBO|nr:RecName: Full=Cytochrome c oxidase subunit 3; AltName: Full=Cytochrome c oxidase polypeptide III [Trypanoplasma borreli]AAA65016.1 cytochrome c oxidase subunit III [Trypanoplasma borreli]